MAKARTPKFTVFAARTDKKGKAYIDMADLDITASDEDEDDAVITLSSGLDLNVHDKIMVLNSQTYEFEEVSL